MNIRFAALLAATLLAFAGCRDEGGGAAPSATTAAKGKLEILPGPDEGSIAAAVHAEGQRAHERGRTLLVYVGAHWCEPCMRFHDAAAAGQLDARFPKLTLMEFDLDRDLDRLAEAGYTSRMIPLFTVPAADGRASSSHIEGSVKGDAAVDEISPRLLALIESAGASR